MSGGQALDELIDYVTDRNMNNIYHRICKENKELVPMDYLTGEDTNEMQAFKESLKIKYPEYFIWLI